MHARLQRCRLPRGRKGELGRCRVPAAPERAAKLKQLNMSKIVRQDAQFVARFPSEPHGWHTLARGAAVKGTDSLLHCT